MLFKSFCVSYMSMLLHVWERVIIRRFMALIFPSRFFFAQCRGGSTLFSPFLWRIFFPWSIDRTADEISAPLLQGSSHFLQRLPSRSNLFRTMNAPEREVKTKTSFIRLLRIVLQLTLDIERGPPTPGRSRSIFSRLSSILVISAKHHSKANIYSANVHSKKPSFLLLGAG